MLSLAKRVRRALSDGLGGQNWKRKFTKGNMAGVVDMSSANFGQLMAGADAGAGWWRNALSGWAWYWDWILLTFGRSAMLKSCVRKRT